MGSEVDLHTPHWHGNTVVVAGMHTDVSNPLPATMQVADMVADDPGSWLLIALPTGATRANHTGRRDSALISPF